MSDVILVTGKSLVPESVRDWLSEVGYEVRFPDRDYFSLEELHEALNGAHGYLIGGFEEPLPEHFESAKALRAIGWVGTDFEAFVPGWRRAVSLGIAFVNAPHANARSVAEYTVLLTLMSLRRIGRRFASLDSPEPFAGPGFELQGKTIGIVGLGHVGTQVARMLKLGFGANVMYTSRTRKAALEAELDLHWATLPELLSKSDVVTLHRPGIGADDAPIFGRSEIDAMKPGAILLNTVKANLVDPDALFDALSSGRIVAAFDAPGSGPAWTRVADLGWGRFINFPQNAFNTEEANLRTARMAAEAVVACLRGGEPPQLINPGYSRKSIS